MGDALFHAVVAARRAEADRLHDQDPVDIAAALRWVC
jgi:hypothetical protein